MSHRAAGLLVSLAVIGVLTAHASAAPGPDLSVDAGAGRHPISPLIYGQNFADPSFAREIRLPLDRWGGNTTDTYNWKLASSNLGNDYYFENVPDCWSSAYGYCANQKHVQADHVQIRQDRRTGADTLLTLPMMGRVASDGIRHHPFTCGFPRSVFPSQNSFDAYDPRCGNGRNGNHNLKSTPSRDSVKVGNRFIAGWIKELKRIFGSSRHGGVRFYELGNEPGIWHETHRDMHPKPLTYDELWRRSSAMARVAKRSDPHAKTIGYSEWGWPNYFCSGADHINNGCSASSPDRARHGGTPLSAWYLRKMRAYQRQHGKRLLDYFDLHYYRQGGSSADVTRSLWDPSFTDPSWINAKIRLIPRMRAWVKNNYPGTKLSLSEYNLSVSGDAVTNALIQADVLGIFAREGLDLATRWPLDNDGGKIDDAFRIYRDYDGHGARFGSQYVRSVSDDQSQLAVYAARRSDGRHTILVINKTGNDLTSDLNLIGFNPPASAETWRWTGSAISRVADQSVSAGGFSATYPAKSLTLFVL